MLQMVYLPFVFATETENTLLECIRHKHHLQRALVIYHICLINLEVGLNGAFWGVGTKVDVTDIFMMGLAVICFHYSHCYFLLCWFKVCVLDHVRVFSCRQWDTTPWFPEGPLPNVSFRTVISHSETHQEACTVMLRSSSALLRELASSRKLTSTCTQRRKAHLKNNPTRLPSELQLFLTVYTLWDAQLYKLCSRNRLFPPFGQRATGKLLGWWRLESTSISTSDIQRQRLLRM